jgi:hypothetical protein
MDHRQPSRSITVDGRLPYEMHFTMRTTLRPAHPEDFDYCARLYFEEMEKIIKELNLNMDAQVAGLRQRWDCDAGSDHHTRWDVYRLVAEATRMSAENECGVPPPQTSG